MKRSRVTILLIAPAVLLMAALLTASRVYAHCDTLDGPVVTTAKTALEKADVTPVLKWVKKENEAEIREVFKKTLAVRGRSPEAKELADMYFFETLVRLHRAGEGAPYTGLKPAGAELDPAVVEADKALENGKIDRLAKHVGDDVAGGIRSRFARAIEARKHAEDSVAKGREFVETYVEFVHYVERLHLDASGNPAHQGEAAAGQPHE